MCGILGYVGVAGGMDVETLIKCRDALTHRGPDGAGHWMSDDGRVALAHRRLAIVDLSVTGAQPMHASDAKLSVAFNGEIYNHGELRLELQRLGHCFRGHSDTEVLLVAYAQWGLDCIDRLRGMFAIALYDHAGDRLVLVRDRVGEKPLYWARHRGGIVFASELKGLFADPLFERHLDPAGLDAYLAFGYVPGDLSLIRGVSKLPPGHLAIVPLSGGDVQVRRYWQLPVAAAGAADEGALVDELEELMRSAVGEQLQADVPVAVLLSGGTDSSLVTACAAAASSQAVNTFSVGFPGAGTFDERPHARRIAHYFGTRHTELDLEASAIDLLPELAHHFDEPIADSSMIPTFLLSRLVAQHVKVVLGGDGGDELFGGYRAYQGALKLARLRAVLPGPLRGVVAGLAASVLPPGFPNRNALVGLGGSFAEGVAGIGLMFDAAARARLAPWLHTAAAPAAPEKWKRGVVEAERGVPGAYMAADFMSYLPGDILVKVDRASMANSLEVRAPFLDRRIVEFAYAKVPNHLRTTSDERKILLRRLARRLLPPDFDVDRKQGFSVPLSNWMSLEYRSLWCDRFEQSFSSIFDFQVIRPLLKTERVGGVTRVFGLLLLMHWMQAHGVRA